MDKSKALADHLRALRLQRDLTLQQLATDSGVSRSTLSRIEIGDVSPTAETLGQLAAAFNLPISQLLAPLEQGFPALVRQSEQSLWRDPEHGYTRRTLSPPSRQLTLEMIECAIEPHQRIAYERPALPGHEHHLVLLSGALALTLDGQRHDLLPGDCLRYKLTGPSCFETGDEPASYIIALA